MKIRSLTIRGFRGFNEERKLEFHERLTLVYGLNSCGKTSISEALEWLLYGNTSKLKSASSRDEYKGSLRNCHLPAGETPSVQAEFTSGKEVISYTGHLVGQDDIQRFIGGQQVESWPFGDELERVPRPFVLQHALKDLLVAAPEARFSGFAKLLGLEDLDRIQEAVGDLRTRPESSIGQEVKRFISDVDGLLDRLRQTPSLRMVYEAITFKGPLEAYHVVNEACKARVPTGTSDAQLLPHLLRIRQEAMDKVLPIRLDLPSYSVADGQTMSEDEAAFKEILADEFTAKYKGMAALPGLRSCLEKRKFFEVGQSLLQQATERCPFCGRPLDEDTRAYIHSEQQRVVRESESAQITEGQAPLLKARLRAIREQVETHNRRHVAKTNCLLKVKPHLSQVKAVLGAEHVKHSEAVEHAVDVIEAVTSELTLALTRLVEALQAYESSVETPSQDAVETYAKALTAYLDTSHGVQSTVNGLHPVISDASQVLAYELDKRAATTEVSLLIELLQRKADIEKSKRIHSILDSLKDFKKAVDAYVAKKIAQIIAVDLTSDVMEWYDRVRTEGDPSVHFTRFDLKRTKKGEPQARRITVGANSYGKELVSAVSCLSESKLNALGLCLCIANNVKATSPFDFILIDDPIQSLDTDHAIRFIGVLEELVRRGKQVVVLSHNRPWLTEVRGYLRHLQGKCYEITGYDKAGPRLKSVEWENWGQRLGAVRTVLKDQNADSVKLQQAEAEIRIILNELVVEYYYKARGVRESAESVDAKAVHRMLAACGEKASFVSKVAQVSSSVSSAHHAPGLPVSRETLQQYVDVLQALVGKVGV